MPALQSKNAAMLDAFAGIAWRAEVAGTMRGAWRRHFGFPRDDASTGRIVVEIGCHDAGFLSRLAQRHPTIGFIGIDWKPRSLAQGAEAIQHRGLRNIALIHARAQDLLDYVAPGEVDEVWLFHPEPCDQPRQAANRLFAEPFLSAVHSALRDDRSTFTLKTDHPGYFQHACALMGVAPPEWFEPARQQRISGERAPVGQPRVRARDLIAPDALPPANDALIDGFQVAVHTTDFWRDTEKPPWADQLYAGELTTYEQGFVSKRLPIYAMMLRKRPVQSDAGVITMGVRSSSIVAYSRET